MNTLTNHHREVAEKILAQYRIAGLASFTPEKCALTLISVLLATEFPEKEVIPGVISMPDPLSNPSGERRPALLFLGKVIKSLQSKLTAANEDANRLAEALDRMCPVTTVHLNLKDAALIAHNERKNKR